MSKKQTETQRMRAGIRETVVGLHRSGIVSRATLAKITARDVDMTKLPRIKAPSGAEIVAMRARQHEPVRRRTFRQCRHQHLEPVGA